MHFIVRNNTKSFSIPYASSIYAPFVALHTSRQYSTLCQTFCNKGWSVFAITFHIWSFKLFRVIGIGRMQTSSFTKPHRIKSRGVRSQDCGGQEVDPPQPIHCSGSSLFKDVVTSFCICGGTPSCSKTTFVLSQVAGTLTTTPTCHGR
jgi:hypothetical protein